MPDVNSWAISSINHASQSGDSQKQHGEFTEHGTKRHHDRQRSRVRTLGLISAVVVVGSVVEGRVKRGEGNDGMVGVDVNGNSQ